MSFSNTPEQTRTKATRSRWRAVHVRLDLEDEPREARRHRRDDRHPSRSRAAAAPGPASRARRESPPGRSCRGRCRRTPASAARPGTRPCRTAVPAPAMSAVSSTSVSCRLSPSSSTSTRIGGVGRVHRGAVAAAGHAARRARVSCVTRSKTPRKRSPLPIGQLQRRRRGCRARARSRRSRSNGSRPGRSSLFTKVMIGRWRRRHDLEELPGLRLDALGGVDDHHRAVDGVERAVGVLAEVLVARRVEQVDAAVAEVEVERRRGDRDAALALHVHPVATRRAAASCGRGPRRPARSRRRRAAASR